MHIPAQDLVNALIPQGAKAGRVAEREAAFEINSTNGLGSRVKNQAEFFLALLQCLLHPLALRNVLNGTTQPEDLAVRIAQWLTMGYRPFCGGSGDDYLHIEFIGSSSFQGFLNRQPQQMPTFSREKFPVFLVGGRRQVGIMAVQAAKLLRPDH